MEATHNLLPSFPKASQVRWASFSLFLRLWGAEDVPYEFPTRSLSVQKRFPNVRVTGPLEEGIGIASVEWRRRSATPLFLFVSLKPFCYNRGSEPKMDTSSSAPRVFFYIGYRYTRDMGRFTWGPKSQVPLILASPNIWRQSPNKPLKIWFAFTKVRSWLFYENLVLGVVLRVGSSFLLDWTLNTSLNPHPQQWYDADIHDILGTWNSWKVANPKLSWS